MARGWLLAVVVSSCVRAALADPFHMRYDAHETFPEQEGWTRYYSDPDGAEVRDVDDEILTLDTRASAAIFDQYVVASDAFALQPGEMFHLEWRTHVLYTDEALAYSDVNVFVANAHEAFAQLYLGADFVRVDEILGGDPEHEYRFQSGVRHTFAIASSDMLTYRLDVDGDYAFDGIFHSTSFIGANVVAFGDVFVGLTSLSAWDYVQVDVTPEPGTLWAGMTIVFLATFMPRR